MPTRISRLLITLMLCWGGISAMSQEATEEAPPQNLIRYGAVQTGQINNQTSNQQFVFDALRCDFLSVRLRTTGGNLDPVLSIFDEDGQLLFSQDDSNGAKDIRYEPLAIPSSGRYTVVVGRFGYRLGTTTGSYELFIERIGNGSADGCVMRYGDTVTNILDARVPEVWYRFQASRGDVIHLNMRSVSGSLDPVLAVADAGGFLLASNDDETEGVIDAAIRSLLIPGDGSYFIRASRYGTTSGSFALTLEEAANSGIGNSPLAALAIRPNSQVEGTLTNDNPMQYYRLDARQNDVISVRMERLSANLDPLLIITDANQIELFEDDDGGEGQNSYISEFLIPASGTYFIVATRFEHEAGLTSGRYRLQLENRGNPFDSVGADVQRIAYGSSVTGSIDNVAPEIRYVFWGTEGDRVTISMSRTSGDLDPLLRLLSATQATLATDDDGGRNNNAVIQGYRLPATGIYYVVATRFSDDAGTTGAFLLTIEADVAEPDEG